KNIVSTGTSNIPPPSPRIAPTPPAAIEVMKTAKRYVAGDKMLSAPVLLPRESARGIQHCHETIYQMCKLGIRQVYQKEENKNQMDEIDTVRQRGTSEAYQLGKEACQRRHA